ncbi:MAG: leucine-rich repeat domain-containing protein [Clostridia bacterium]|nr:leucine-rich repeat domain-containing protein [Clostridia bacterium]
MKKKRLLFIMTITTMLVCIFGFSACREQHEHAYTAEITKNATCIEKGLITYTCSCGSAYTQEILALGHDEKTHEAKAPTCTEIGWNEYVTCEREGCEYSTYQEISVTGVHTWDDGTVTTEPTCTEKGVKTFTCTVCETATYTEDVEALTHDEKTHQAKAPTCTEIGWEEYVTCEREGCEYSTYQEIPATGVHTWDKGEETKAPTCTKEGETTYTCTVCKTATKTEPIDKLPHEHSTEWESNDTHHWHECECGDKENEEKHTAGAPATVNTPQTCTVCGYVLQEETGILFNTLTVDGTNVYGTVRNAITEFSFVDEVAVVGKAKFILSFDKNGVPPIPTKKITLQEGNNVAYVFEMLDDELRNTYTVNLYRLHKYEVIFDVDGGTPVEKQTIEEGYLATEPTTTRTGYTFTGWDYDFTKPITENTTITAGWYVNKDTKYTVNYYLQNLDDDEYTLYETEKRKGETDTTVEAEIKEYTHFTLNQEYFKNVLSGNIDGDGSQVLSVYYKRNFYTISTTKSNDKAGVISGAGTYKYDKQITLTANTNAGYTWLGWYEGETCVCKDEVFTFKAEKSASYTATWSVNTDTKYTVIYYLQNIDNDNYTPHETVEGKGKTDTTATAAIKEYAHFTYNASMSTVSGNIDGDGGRVLSVYYTRNAYVLSVNNTTYGTITNKGTYKYGKAITATATPHLGYEFIGWYSGNELLSTDLVYAFTVDKNVTAKFALKAEMSGFNFTSTTTTCEITGVKNKYVTEIVVPDYVTSISEGAFSGCSSLKSITIPFVGGSRKTATDTYQYPFGYIFGANSYTGGTETVQSYYGSSTSSTTSTTYYIPTSLKTVVVKGGNILYGAFESCNNLTSITIPDGITSIGDCAFEFCKGLTSITVPASVITIGENAFYYCNSLTSITVPDGVNSIGDYAFAYCNGLTSIAIPDSVTSIGKKAFYDCSYLTSIIVSENNTVYQSIDGNLYSKDGKTLIQYAIGKSATSFSLPINVTAIGDYAFAYCHRLTSITIPNSVVSIGKGAFCYCDSATGVVIGENVITIGEKAFAYCASVKSVSLGNSVNTIGDYAFKDCNKLASITIPDNITSIGEGAFYYCNGLWKVYVDSLAAWCNISFGDSYANPLWYAGSLYVNNEYITDLVIPDGVTSIGDYAFESCENMKSITIPASVNSIGNYAFGSGMDTMLKGIYITDLAAWCNISFSNSSANPLWRVENLYVNNEIITEFVIPDGVSTIGNYAFCQFKNLTNVVIPNSVTSIGEKAFAYCDGLTSIDIPASVISIEKMAFYGCTNLANVTVDQNNTAYQSIEGNLYTKDGTRLIQYAAAKTATTFIIPDGVISIENGAFSECYHLTSVVMPDSVVYVGDDAFYWCNRLKSVEFSNSITTIGAYAFYNCGSLTSVVIPNSVVSIGEKAFYQCNRLIEVINKSTHITVEKGYSTNGYVGYYALAVYNSDSGITESQLLNDNGYVICTDGDQKVLVGYVGTETDLVLPSYITEIHERAFYNCNTLTSVVIPDSITSIGVSAFYGCSSLESITMPFGWYRKDGFADKPLGYLFGGSSYKNNASYVPTSLKEVRITCGGIDQYAFYGCNSLTSVVIGDGVTSIGDYAFATCSSLTNVVIPDSVTSIGIQAFYSCGLTNVEIGGGVMSIGKEAFYKCGNLASVTFKDTFAWYQTTNLYSWQNKTGGTNTSVEDSSTNAKYFRMTYYDYYWYKL